MKLRKYLSNPHSERLTPQEIVNIIMSGEDK